MNLDRLLLPFLGGVCVGAVFFGGLWWTIRRGLASTHPELWFLASLMLRISLATSAFLLLAQGEWQRLVASLFGFLLSRSIVLHCMSKPADLTSPSVKGHRTCG